MNTFVDEAVGTIVDNLVVGVVTIDGLHTGTMADEHEHEGGTMDGSVVEGIGEGEGSTKAALIAIWSEDWSVMNVLLPVTYTL